MADYTHTVLVEARADQVFAFVATVGNLPKYLPTVQSAQMLDGDRVAGGWQPHGHPYHGAGFFKVTPGRRAVDWGSDAQTDSGGHMDVHASGEHSSLVTCLLHITPKPPSLAMGSESGRDAAILERLRSGLQRLKAECEGTDGTRAGASAF